MSTTLEQFVQRLASVVGAGEEPINFSATGGSTTTIASTSAIFAKTAATAYTGRDAVITDTTDDAAPEGEARPVTSFSGTTLTVGTAYSATLTSGDDVTLLPGGLHLPDFLEAINDILRNLPLPRYLPVTDLTDGDMETSGVTSWTDAVGTPTQTKETTAALVLTGTQSLKLVTTTVDHAVTSVSRPVTEGEQRLMWAPIKVTAGSLRLSVYDVTNSVEIEGETIDEEAWTVPVIQYTVPSGCQNVAARLVAKTASTTAYVDHVGSVSCEVELLDTPSQITDTALIEGVDFLPLGFPSEANNSYLWGEDPEPWATRDELRDYRALTQMRFSIRKPSIYPLFWRFRATNTALSAMSDVAYIDDDLLEAALPGMASVLFAKLAIANEHNGNTQQAARYKGWSEENARTYRTMLDSLGLAEPIIQKPSQPRRVA